MTIETYTSTQEWVCPEGVTTVTVRAWGSGEDGVDAGAGENGKNGGHGGAYAQGNVTVVPTTSYTLTIPGGNSVTDTSFETNVIAECGRGGGLASGSTGTTKYDGGAGGGGNVTGGGGGGGGGGSGSAGSAGAGGAGGSGGGAGGTGTYPGGNGGNGAIAGANGNTGLVPGGGGGGAHSSGATPRTGGAGVRGEIVLEYSVASSNMLIMF